jgi:acyl-CoA thioester hydrolase
MANEIFRCTHRVTYAECTVGNHVYYARFLDLLETARGEFFRAIGTTFLQWQQAGLAFPVLECQLHYKAPARYDDLLLLELWLTQLQRVRLSFAYRILNEERKLVLEAATHHICASTEEKPRRLPESLLASLGAYLHRPMGSAESAAPAPA